MSNTLEFWVSCDADGWIRGWDAAPTAFYDDGDAFVHWLGLEQPSRQLFDELIEVFNLDDKVQPGECVLVRLEATLGPVRKA